jgi:hypothetical protein
MCNSTCGRTLIMFVCEVGILEAKGNYTSGKVTESTSSTFPSCENCSCIGSVKTLGLSITNQFYKDVLHDILLRDL